MSYHDFFFQELEFPEAYAIYPAVFEDERGSLTKDYSRRIFIHNGIDYGLEEVFYTQSYKGVLRGIHFQRIKEQPKLVRCLSGSIFDVIVDIRKDSPYFGQWRGFQLTGENCLELLIPGGFGHGYLVLEDAIVSYKCAAAYSGEYDDGIVWNDEELSIKWPIEEVSGKLIVSEKDKQLPTFSQYKAKMSGTAQ